jgi:hypothetical protein
LRNEKTRKLFDLSFFSSRAFAFLFFTRSISGNNITRRGCVARGHSFHTEKRGELFGIPGQGRGQPKRKRDGLVWRAVSVVSVVEKSFKKSASIDLVILW